MQEQFWEDNNPAIKYSGKWTRVYHSMYHGSAVMRTQELGDSMSVKFKGSAIKLMGAQGFDHGSFLVNLDGEETVVDGHCCGLNAGVPQVIQFEAIGLSTAEHTLNITNYEAGRLGTSLEVDALLITSHPGRSYLPLAIILLAVWFGITLVIRRRRLLRGANAIASYQLLPLAAPQSPNPEHTPQAPAGPSLQQSVRRDKGAPPSYSEEEHSTAGASGSGSGQNLPHTYAPHIDDELIERIAQRLARLVQNDAPPTYETNTDSQSLNQATP